MTVNLSPPALFAHRFLIPTHLGTVEISLGVDPSTESQKPSRTAVFLTNRDARELVEIIATYLGAHEARLDRLEAAHTVER